MTAALTHALSFVVLTAMIALCMRRSKAAGSPLDLPCTLYVHRVWYGFTVFGGVFLIAIFAYAGTLSAANQTPTIWASIISAAVFSFAAFTFTRMSVTLDENSLTYRTIFRTRTVDLRLLKDIRFDGMNILLLFTPAQPGARPQKPLRILAAFKGLRELSDHLTARLESSR